MKYKRLGNTGLKVSELCFGAMSFGDTWGYGSTQEESKKCFDAFVEAGGNFFDTSSNYSEGRSEEVLGEFIKGNREKYVIATKCSLCSPAKRLRPNDPNGAGNGRKHLREELELSLKRLQTNYIDVLYVHGWDFTVTPKELMATLNDFVREGKVSYLGISNTPAYIVAMCNTIADQYGWEKFSVYEGKYNLLDRSCELEVLPMVCDLQMSLTVWQPLAGALLCGSEEELEIRIKSGYQRPTPEQMTIIKEVNAIAKELNVSVPQVALNWLRQQSNNIIPIMGVRLAEHVEDNLKALDWKLSKEQLDRLNKVSKINLIYPQADLLGNINDYVYNYMEDQIDAEEVFPYWMKNK